MLRKQTHSSNSQSTFWCNDWTSDWLSGVMEKEKWLLTGSWRWRWLMWRTWRGQVGRGELMETDGEWCNMYILCLLSYVMMMPFKRQALVEFSAVESADRCVSHGANEPVYIAGLIPKIFNKMSISWAWFMLYSLTEPLKDNANNNLRGYKNYHISTTDTSQNTWRMNSEHRMCCPSNHHSV